MNSSDTLANMRGGLIVSCQARGDNPLRGSVYMVAMAQAAVMGGAVAIRAEGTEDIREIRASVSVPVIGLLKVDYPDSPVYITPTWRELAAVLDSGAQVVAVDATARPRPGGLGPDILPAFVERIHSAQRLAMADISTVDEARMAEEAGFDLIATTLSGYTPYSPQQTAPDVHLIEQCVAACQRPIVAEGRIWDPTLAAKALNLGAFAVTVGTAITDPRKITARFVAAMQTS